LVDADDTAQGAANELTVVSTNVNLPEAQARFGMPDFGGVARSRVIERLQGERFGLRIDRILWTTASRSTTTRGSTIIIL
jgi:hypothetical protein